MSATVILCEKPSQAQAIAKMLPGPRSKGDGFIETGGGIVTWAIGHLVEQVFPEEYDPAYKKWSMDHLPIIPQQWITKPVSKTRSQYRVVIGLLKKAKHVIIATDAGREGELIARELMSDAKFKGQIQRLWVSSLDDESLRKALDNLLDGKAKEGLYHAALCRQRADWLYGMNLSRAATMALAPPKTVFSYGRVQTPTLAMIVKRDLEIENFKPKDYFEVLAQVQAQSGTVTMRYAPGEEQRMWKREEAEAIIAKIHNAQGPISVKTEKKRKGPPRPYSLSDLQGDANQRFNLSAAQTLEIAQALYERHKAISYPRADSNYLPEEQVSDIPRILGHLNDAGLLPVAINKPMIRKSVFNTAKVNESDHHAIIPTTTKPPVGAMSDVERKVYGLVVTRFLMQLLPDYEYKATTMILMAAKDVPLVAKGQVPLVQGWRVLEGKKASKPGAEDEENKELPPIQDGETGTVTDAQIDVKSTKPPARYTEKTLLKDMGNIQKYVEDPKFKKILKESSGIGTEATRASIIEVLKKRGFIKVENKRHLVSQPLGRALIQALPEKMYHPALCAAWEDYLESLAAGQRSYDEVISALTQQMTKMLEEIKGTERVEVKGYTPKGGKKAPPRPEGDAPPCPKCGGETDWRHGKHGGFWGCKKYPDCTGIVNVADPNAPQCPECGKSMRKRKGAYGDFWGCTDYPNCKGIINIEGKGGGKKKTTRRKKTSRKTATA